MHQLTKARGSSAGRRGLIAIWSACLIALVDLSPVAHAQSLPNQSTPLQSAPLQSTPLQSTPLQSTPLQSSPAPSKPSDYPAVLTTAPNVVEIRADGKVFRLGAECKRRTDNEPGVYRKDGCNRWYCGRADKEDLSAILPRLSVTASCTWRVEASNQCVCRKVAAETAPRRGSP